MLSVTLSFISSLKDAVVAFHTDVDTISKRIDINNPYLKGLSFFFYFHLPLLDFILSVFKQSK